MKNESTTEGYLHIMTLPSIQNLLAGEAMVYKSFYKSDLNFSYGSEQDAIKLFNSDSIYYMVIPRKPDKEEFRSEFSNVRILPFYRSGLVIIGNEKVPDHLSLNELKEHLNGRVNYYQFIIQDKDIDILNYLNGIINSEINEQNIFALEDVEKLINYVAKNDNVLGIVDFSQLDPRFKNLLKENEVKIISLKNKPGSKSVFPSQSSIASSNYPLTRTFYIIYRTNRMGIAGGFTTFLLSDTGQRIILKEGLVPVKPPQRNLKIVR